MELKASLDEQRQLASEMSESAGLQVGGSDTVSDRRTC